MIEAIYERRTGKILELAILQQQAKKDELLPDEKELYDIVYNALDQVRTRTFDQAVSR